MFAAPTDSIGGLFSTDLTLPSSQVFPKVNDCACLFTIAIDSGRLLGWHF